MSISVGYNSWATIEEANEFFNTRLGSAKWFTLSDTGEQGEESKESVLVTAFYWLLDDATFNLSESLTGRDIQRVQFEATLFLLSYREDYEKRQALIASGVKSFSNSKWSESLGQVSKPSSIVGILTKLKLVNGNGTAQLMGDDYNTDLGTSQEIDSDVIGYD